MCRILVLEDDVQQAEYLCRILEAEGMDTRAARTASDAISLADSFDPDLVIADYRLCDDTSGLDVVRLLRARSPRIEAIMLTGFSEELEDGEALAPMTISKPLDLDDFLAVVKRLDRQSCDYHHAA